MQPDLRRLQDILAAADELETFLRDIDSEDFADNRVLLRAVERLLIIIGEAAKQLRPETRAAIQQPWAQIIRFRDRGVHVDDSLSPAALYLIATQSVPALAVAVRAHTGKGA